MKDKILFDKGIIMYEKKFPGSSDTVYQKLREQILHLELPPLTAVSEIETAAKYDVSRTPVRDAFKMLEAEGLLEVRPHVGTFVTQIDLHMISDILYMREQLEQAILKDLSQTYDETCEQRIQVSLQRQKELIEADLPIEELSRAFIVEDNNFHYILNDLAGRKNVSVLFNFVVAQYERFRTLVNLDGKETLLKLYQEHVEIVRCIAEQDYDALAKQISKHIYEGFHNSSEVIRRYPEYFKKVDE